MKRIAIGIDQPPGRLVDEKIVISRNGREEAGDVQREFNRGIRCMREPTF